MAVISVRRGVTPAGYVLQACWTYLDRLADRRAEFAAYLSADETAKADAFRAAQDRHRFIARHGWLREQLAARLGQHPAWLAFEYNAFGKPRLADGALGFSLSHSHGVALLVCGPVSEIGCDIEWRDPEIDRPAVADRFFSTVEREALVSLAPVQSLIGFYHGWTRKEAYVKALGCGLSRPLDSFDVELRPSQPARLLRGCEGWSVASFEPVAEFQAAVVAPGKWQLKPAPGSSDLLVCIQEIQNLAVQ